MHKLETTRNYPWPNGVCFGDTDPSDPRDPWALARLAFLRIRALELGAGKLQRTTPEDFASEAHMVLMRLPDAERERLGNPKEFGPYASRILRNLIADATKEEVRLRRIDAVDVHTPEAVATEGAPQEVAMEEDEAAEWAKTMYHLAMDRLSARQQEAIHLIVEDELKREAAAAQMGVSLETLKDHLRVARRTLRDFAEEYTERDQ